MKVLFTSKSSAGAWQIRGHQISATHPEWVASNHPTVEEIQDADIVCIVKKTDSRFIELCRKYNKIVALDVVDFWPQSGSPHEFISRRESLELAAELVRKVNPNALIFPNHAMWAALRSAFPAIPATFIYHHFRPEFAEPVFSTANNQIATIGYEGGNYLGEWGDIIDIACNKFGIKFVVNPKSLLEVDAVVSARGRSYRTFLNCNFKSNVKATNAIGAMKPFLCHVDERSAHEVDPGTFLFFNSSSTLEAQIDYLLDNDLFLTKNQDVMRTVRPRYRVDTIGAEFGVFFERVLEWYR